MPRGVFIKPDCTFEKTTQISSFSGREEEHRDRLRRKLPPPHLPADLSSAFRPFCCSHSPVPQVCCPHCGAPPCARRRQTAGTVDRRIGRRREAAVRCYQALSCSCSSRCPRTPRSFPTFCRCRCSFCRRRCCCSRNSSCLRGQSSYPVPPRECGLPPGSATHSCRRSELRTVCRRAPTALRPLAMPRKRSRAGRWSAKRAPHSCPSLSRAGEGPRQSTTVRPHSAGQSQFSTCPESHSAPHPAHRSEP